MPLANPKAFFDRARGADLLGSLSPTEVEGCNAILAACAAWPLSHVAYALATAYHETAGTMQPIKELGGADYLRRLYDIEGRDPDRAKAHGNVRPGDGQRYCGRGYVQLTWQVNYAKASAKTGVDLVADPEAAKRPDVAARIMESGMREGWFTGKRLSDSLPENGPAEAGQFTSARRVINGTDRAADISRYALKFQAALVEGGWS